MKKKNIIILCCVMVIVISMVYLIFYIKKDNNKNNNYSINKESVYFYSDEESDNFKEIYEIDSDTKVYSKLDIYYKDKEGNITSLEDKLNNNYISIEELLNKNSDVNDIDNAKVYYFYKKNKNTNKDFIIYKCDTEDNKNIYIVGKTNNDICKSEETLRREKALKYIDIYVNQSKTLVEKLYNSNKVTVKNLSNEDKMFMSIIYRNVINDGLMYGNGDGYDSFKASDLENLIFEDTSFINDYKESKSYNLKDFITLEYKDNLYKVTAKSISSFELDGYIEKLITKSYEKDNTLVIEFKMAYVIYGRDRNGNLDSAIIYKSIGTDKKQESIEFDKQDNYSDINKELNINWSLYNTYRYTLKIDNDNLYFESLEIIG